MTNTERLQEADALRQSIIDKGEIDFKEALEANTVILMKVLKVCQVQEEAIQALQDEVKQLKRGPLVCDISEFNLPRPLYRPDPFDESANKHYGEEYDLSDHFRYYNP